MNSVIAGSVTDLQSLLNKRVRGAKASFFLGLALFLTSFVAFLHFALAPLNLNGAVTGFTGFLAGIYFFAWGVLWSMAWSLAVHLNGLVSDLAKWIASVLNLAIDQLDNQFATGTIVDLEVVEQQIGSIVATQSAKLGGESALATMANQVAPGAAKAGLRFLVVRVAGDVWREEKLTVEALRSQAGRIAVEAAVMSIRRMLWVAIGVLLALAGLLVAAPFGITAVAGWITKAF